jgi:methionine synthase II (cobalamin-independent)
MATGIGSLPFTDPQEALALILAELPQCPHWPQLPRCGRREHFVHQFLQPLVACGILVSDKDRWYLDISQDTSADRLTEFYSSCLAAEEGSTASLRSFLPPTDAAAGLHAFLDNAAISGLPNQTAYVKGQIAGPLTIALELKDEQNRPAYYREDLRDILVRTLALNARAQAAALSLPGSTPIIFIDDPAISAVGSRLHLALDRTAVLEDLNFIAAAIHSEKGLAGVHSCETIDWSLLTDSAIDIISVDTYRFGSSLIPYAAQLKAFLKRGKTIAWGIVPTLDDVFGESAESLLQRLFELWNDLFGKVPASSQVLRQSMITPACGAGLLSREQAQQIYRLTAKVSLRIAALAN